MFRSRSTPPPGLAVVAACWSVQQLPALPPVWVAAALAIAGLLLLSASLRRAAWLACIGAGAAAAGWALLLAAGRLEERLPAELEGADLRVVGVVEDMPQSDDRGLRFRFLIERCETDGKPCPAPRSVRLGWYSGSRPWGGVAAPAAPARRLPDLRPGERWELTVRLKRPHASLNPYLFDSELRSVQEGISAVGYVRLSGKGAVADGAIGEGAAGARRIDAFVARPALLVERARHAIRERMLSALDGADAVPRGVLVALTVGDQAAISVPWWELFNRTGIGHLMSISGLHITMLAALGAALAGRVWKSRRLAQRMHPASLPARWPAPYARWTLGLLVAFSYAGLAGWGIPAQRTCWMIAAAGLALLGGRARSPVSVLSTAGAAVCVLDPWAPLAAGFWLSFAAVASIVWYGSARGGGAARADAVAQSDAAAQSPAAAPADGWRARLRRTLREALRSQFAATLVLIPLGVLFFSSVSLVSPLANAVAIPLVSGVITPLALAGAALAMAWEPLGAWALWIASWLTGVLLAGLQWLDAGSASALPVARPGAFALLLAAAACAFVLAPVRFGGRWLAGLGLCPLLLAPADRPATGEIRLTALDVGQGTAVLVETARGRLLYDTGPALGPESDAGSRVLVPWLRARGIDRLEALVISHEDLDHAGGALAVLEGVAVDWVSSSLPDEHPVLAASPRHYPCRRGERWEWGEVGFEWLHPGPEPIGPARSKTNARSCVLRVHGAAGAVLLAGDIEAAQERRLLSLIEPGRLRAQVLLAPHHGSRTSSSPAFLDAVAPELAVFQVGYRNRYRHPNPAVLERYRARGIGVLRSDAHAAIEIRLQPGQAPQVVRHRIDRPRWWRVPVAEDATAPSSPRRSSRPRPAPAGRRRSTGRRRARRSAPG
ncbi:MAG: DNA internalization-related competence protein ComEC/Rec2 [Gammaproteobacteria bacterium]